ncbi:hypothetical protein Bhyg_15186 [Pseudolycoriella hygida]|uniref:Uncharacterized protein n=1 Tax=Pseudolycoriella hygida TaxID=35572 RepID=A0A9Q0RWC6_9DIPT|nr:hypothetical protein Bhyg_15186 [Pseudolycoriella hygida]
MKTDVKIYLWFIVIGLLCLKTVPVTSDKNDVEQLIPTVFVQDKNGQKDQTMRKWIPQCEFVPEVFDLNILLD